MHACVACVDAVRHALQPVPGCVGMLHKPCAGSCNHKADSSNIVYGQQVAQYVTSMLSDINVPGWMCSVGLNDLAGL
jgi:hypothetical protein